MEVKGSGLDPIEWARSLGFPRTTVTHWRLDLDYAELRLVMAECRAVKWTPWKSRPNGWSERSRPEEASRLWVYPDLDVVVEEARRVRNEYHCYRLCFELTFE